MIEYIEDMSDEYVTILHPGHAEIRILASKFIAAAFPACSKPDVDLFLQEIRKEYFDATHHCFAYRLGPEGRESRASDDGEPGGTAGKPILAAIDREGLTNVAVVVVRYFGGTKLGTGGLVRAYGEAAAQAVREAGRKSEFITALLSLSVEHSRVSHVMHVVSRSGARIAETRYDEVVHFRLEIRRSRLDALRGELIQATSGGVLFED